MSLLTAFFKIISTFFYSGFFPKAPGTFGTLMGALLYSIIVIFLDYSNSYLLYITIVVILVSIISSHYAIRIFNSNDPQCVVIDEVAGIFVTMLFIPFSIPNLLMGIILFRLFDIWKPLFIKSAEKMHGGLGITMDDVLAGLASNIILRLIIF
ncbi:phosphatidylglycerophosphatase A [bacterium]|jgi:phosphatidylglycerophosphatase A|nr:phosphatidylglycerophosphatase A [bacterium]MBT3849672.1 phosphatidylglycerophosphatase A [bacterium]MBT4434792.1 phosphatidylglycerophosphatase A [bacterium]MDG2445414.1 phosphatidylglycerophosphatase A [Thermodesulfobacteriota bacterium]